MFHRPLGCTAAAVLPNQDSGTSQILVNPTQVYKEMGHPAQKALQGGPYVCWRQIKSSTTVWTSYNNKVQLLQGYLTVMLCRFQEKFDILDSL